MAKKQKRIVGDGKTMSHMGFKQSMALGFFFSLFISVVIYRLMQVAVDVFAEMNLLTLGDSVAYIMENPSVLTTILQKSVQPPYLVYNVTALITAVVAGLVIFAIIAQFVMMSNKHPYKKVEQGSARFGTPADIEPFMSKPPLGKPYFYNRKNIILTKTEGLSLDRNDLPGPEYFRNANILVIGGSGSGKTRYFVTPNIMQMHSSYVVTDPKGEILRNTGNLLEANGYDVRVFNLNEPLKSSVRYNPFRYIRKEDDILHLIQVIIKSTTPPNAQTQDPFWEKAETALFMALFAYVHYYLPPEDQHIGTVLSMLTKLKGSDDFGGGNEETEIDQLFARLPDSSFAKKNFDVFRLSQGRTRSSILVSAGVRLAPWNIQSIQWLMREDTIDFPSIATNKVALFLIVPDSKTDFNFIAAMAYTQMFDTLYYLADNVYNGSLPIHVRFMLDEFPNIGRIPDFEEKLATMRSRNISASIIIQGLSQLKGMYSDKGQEAWEKIPSNCDSTLMLGTQEEGTLKYFSERMGKTTIIEDDKSYSKGKSGSTSQNFKPLGRELMRPEEIFVMSNNECLLTIRGVYPFKSEKFNIKEHPDYSGLAECNKKYFNMDVIPNLRYKAFFGIEEAEKDKSSTDVRKKKIAVR